MNGQDNPARRKLFSVIVEGTLIVASVLLGFAVAKYGESRSEAALKARAPARFAEQSLVDSYKKQLDALRAASNP